MLNSEARVSLEICMRLVDPARVRLVPSRARGRFRPSVKPHSLNVTEHDLVAIGSVLTQTSQDYIGRRLLG